MKDEKGGWYCHAACADTMVWSVQSPTTKLCESIESPEQGGTDEMDVTRMLDPLMCPGAWNRGFTLGRVFRLIL